MKRFVPKGIAWGSFIVLVLIGIAGVIGILFSLKLLNSNVGYALGSVVGQALIVYFLSYVPARIIYEGYLK